MDDKSNASGTAGASARSDTDSVDILSETIPLGKHLGRRVFVGPSRDPEGAPVPDEFGANLYVPNEGGENVDIARIDTAHEGVHIDRLYLPEDHRNYQHDYSVDIFSPREALEYFLENDRWKRWIEKYDRNHGLPQKATDIDRDT